MPITTRVVIGIVSFGIGLTGIIVANMLLMAMIGEVNRKRSERPFSYFGFTLPKTVRIFREYRLLYPAGRLHVYSAAAVALTFIASLSVALCLGLVG